MHKSTVFSRNKILRLFFASIFLCFLATTAVSVYSLSKVIDANDQNAARLISTTVHSHIRDFLSTHISAAKTMAEDFYLKKSLREDAKKPVLDPGMPEQALYLRGFVRTTGIDTAYIVSDATRRYFSHRGLHKVIDPADANNPAHEHDTWYSAFIKTGENRNIQIDTNPVEGDEWTIFFNNRIDDDDAELLGVCGVGIRMARLQSLLLELEKRYCVEIHITNDAETSQIDSQRVVIDKRYLTLTESSAPSKPITFTRTEGNGWQCRMGLDKFGWELVIAQAAYDVTQTFSFLIVNNILLFLCLFGLLFFVIQKVSRSEKAILAKMAHVDALTGLENRSAIERVRDILQDERTPGGLFVIDVDDFKDINDTLGNPTGDILLQRIAGILQSSFRKGDVVARIGGDEFMVYALGMHGVERIRTKAEQLEKAIKGIHRLRETPEETDVSISVSMGIALFPLHGKTYNELYHCAAKVLYRAKAEGKNRFVIFDSCHKE